jgi:hypothetical protein
VSTGLPWKLYLAIEGEPRQLVDAFQTLREACSALAEIGGVAGGKMQFAVNVDTRPTSINAVTARFVHTARPTPYIIELFE